MGAVKKAMADARLLPGDVVVIPPAGPRVALVGALDNPAVYELGAAEESLQSLLRYSGGQQVLSATHKVLVERIRTGEARAPREVQERALYEAGLKSTVRDGDVVTLLNLSPEFANAVTLRGNVAQPLRYAYKPGMRVSDLIPEPEALIQADYYTRKNILVQRESLRPRAIDRELATGQRATAEQEQRSATDVRNLLEEINRAYKYSETLYELFAKQYELARVDEAREGAVIQVVDPDTPPEKKAKPKKALIAVIATLAAGFALLVWVFIRQAIRNACQNPLYAAKLKDLKNATRRAIAWRG